MPTAIKLFIFVELLLAFVLLPYIIAIGILPRNPLPYLWIGSAIAVGYLARNKNTWGGTLWGNIGTRQEIIDVAHRLIIAAVILVPAALIILDSDQLFFLPRRLPLLWVAIIFLYPILSAYPQALIYRAFFAERYKVIFSSPITQSIASAVLFACGHIILKNYFAFALTIIGGVIFFQTYKKTNSLLLSTLEQSFYGLLLFTLGFGKFFYHGYVR